MFHYDISWIFLIILISSITSLGLFWLWRKVEYAWLEKVCFLLVLTFPFQGFPSLLGGVANLRLSQAVVMLGLGLVLLLLLKKDKALLQQKIHPIFYWMLGFILVSAPSWFLVEQLSRFGLYMVGLLLVFGATFLLVHFAKDVGKLVRYLLLSMLVACAFAVYQFVADMAGFTEYSLLRANYTKEIFGIPRVHSFFLEPLLFAGGLFFPIIMMTFAALSRQSLIVLSSSWQAGLAKFGLGFINRPYVFQIFLLLVFLGFFVLTYSKSAFFALAVAVLPILVLAVWKYRDWLSIKILSVFGVLGVLSLAVLSFFSGTLRASLLEIWGNFQGSLLGESATAAHRDAFVETALDFWPRYMVTGAGPGQYGPLVGFALRGLGGEQGTLIINNIYLETWFEYGFLAWVLFTGFWLILLWQNWLWLRQVQDWYELKTVLRLGLLFGLMAYLIQWWFFSPLYIMPIFILLGLLLAIGRNVDEKAERRA